MAQPINPYVAGTPLRGERGFFGRQDILVWVARELRNPATNALVLFGQRRIGKTSLLLQLQRTLPTDTFFTVYVDLQDQGTRSLGLVLADWADTVAERVNIEVPDPDDFDDQGHFFRRTFLPQLYAVVGENCRPVFLMDEFDVLDQAAEATLPETAAARALFPFLRRVMTENPHPAFVFVVGRRAEDLSLDFTTTFKASLVREIWVLDRESAEALVRQAEANGTLHFTDQAVERILSLTSCHPYLSQLLCQRMWERAYAGNPSAPPQIDAPEVVAAVPDALEAGDQALAWLWKGLAPAEKIYASALAEVAGEGETITKDSVIRVLTDHAARLRTREVELAPSDLVKRRVLEEVEEQKYRFAVELFRHWVHLHKRLRDVKDELDRVEPRAELQYDLGLDCFNQREWETAVRYFREALETNPRHFRARFHLGEALLEQGQVHEAVAELEQAYELDRDEARYSLARALIAQATALEKAGDDPGALAACERVLQVSPNEQAAEEIWIAIWTRRGDAALTAGDFDEALSAYVRAGLADKAVKTGRQFITRLDGNREYQAALGVARRLHEQYLGHPDLPPLEQLEKKAQLEIPFRQGLRALQDGDRKASQTRLLEVVTLDPEYPQAASYLHLALTGVDVADLQTQLDREIEARQKAEAAAQAGQLLVEEIKRLQGRLEDEKIARQETERKYLQLSPSNPSDYLRLLWWLFMAPEQLKNYKERWGEDSLHQIGKWLASTLTWLPLFLSSLALALGGLPSTPDSRSPIIYLWLGTGLALACWLLTGFLGDRDDIGVGCVAGVVAAGAAVVVAIGVASIATRNTAVGIAVGIASITASVVAGVMAGSLVNVVTGIAAVGAAVVVASVIMAGSVAGVVAGIAAGGAVGVVGGRLQNSLTTGNPSRLARGTFGVLVLVPLLIVLYSFLRT